MNASRMEESGITGEETNAAYARNWIGGVVACLVRQEQLSAAESSLFDDLGHSVDLAFNQMKSQQGYERARSVVSLLSDLEQAVGAKVEILTNSVEDSQQRAEMADQMRLGQLRSLAALTQS